MLAPWKKSYDQPRSHIKKQRHYFANKCPSSQSYGFSSGHVWMWELEYNESLAPKNWCFWSVVLEKTLESPLDCKEIQPVHPKGNQFWLFIGRTDAEAEVPILWLPHAKSWLIGKDPDAGKDWSQEEKGQQRMRCWMPSLTRWTWVWASSRSWWSTVKPSMRSPWDRKVSDMTEWLNWTDALKVAAHTMISPLKWKDQFLILEETFLRFHQICQR